MTDQLHSLIHDRFEVQTPVVPIEITEGITVGGDLPLLIAGPCVIEGEELTLRIAETLKKATEQWGIPFVFKASFDKANRTSLHSYRGPGLEEGLRILRRVKQELEVAITTDIHLPQQAGPVSEVADIIQIPAFLCRQTDLLVSAALTGKTVNIKKGQFLSPEEVRPLVEKIKAHNNPRVLITERGTSFGYQRLVVDFTGIVYMRSLGIPVILDITHSVQKPGAQGDRSGGDWRYAPYLAMAGVSVGVEGIFLETHPEPEHALSDGPNMIPLSFVPLLLERMHELSLLKREQNARSNRGAK